MVDIYFEEKKFKWSDKFIQEIKDNSQIDFESNYIKYDDEGYILYGDSQLYAHLVNIEELWEVAKKYDLEVNLIENERLGGLALLVKTKQ